MSGWIALALGVVTGAVQAGEADVVDVSVHATADKTFRFDVTVRHGDTGWDHFADRWQILAPDGSVLGTRVLYHPHIDEQPFTRSLSGVEIEEGITDVTLRAGDSVHAFGGRAIEVHLPGR